jgi:hypothetical protein
MFLDGAMVDVGSAKVKGLRRPGYPNRGDMPTRLRISQVEILTMRPASSKRFEHRRSSIEGRASKVERRERRNVLVTLFE